MSSSEAVLNQIPVKAELVEVAFLHAPSAASAASLTATEQAVLRLLARGCSNAQIGQCFARSEKTVRNWLTRIYAKLGVANRAEAVAVHMRMEFDRGR